MSRFLLAAAVVVAAVVLPAGQANAVQQVHMTMRQKPGVHMT